MESDQFDEKRRMLINYLISEGILRTEKVINAFESVPRHLFLTAEHLDEAYVDAPIPIVEGTTISQPSVVAEMLEELELEDGNKVLEVGTGSGWLTGLLSYCVGENGLVISLDGNMFVVEFAKRNLDKINVKNVEVIIADGTLGYKRRAPYDRIIYSIAMPEFPKIVLDQLKINGIAIAPIGSKDVQQLVKITREGEKKYKTEELGDVVFAPAYGKFGFHNV